MPEGKLRKTNCADTALAQNEIQDPNAAKGKQMR